MSVLNEKERILKDALCNTVKMLRFLDDYVNLLQEYISPEDYNAAMEHFDEIAEAHRRVLRQVSDEQIAYEAKIILDAAGEELSSAELADILNLDAMSVEFALSKFSKKIYDELIILTEFGEAKLCVQ